jgi:hypothetical protein
VDSAWPLSAAGVPLPDQTALTLSRRLDLTRFAREKYDHFALRADRLDQAFLFERMIDIDTYDRHRDTLREELTLVRIEPTGVAAPAFSYLREPRTRNEEVVDQAGVEPATS